MIRKLVMAIALLSMAPAQLFMAPAQRARADAPPGRYKTDTATGTTTDTRTSLIWQTRASASTYLWDGAASYCRTLGAGWRLPALKELLTIVDPTRADPAIDPAFPETPAHLFWTASPFTTPGYAWSVHFYNGTSGNANPLGTAMNYVRCVR